jgi:hypothetical protein
VDNLERVGEAHKIAKQVLAIAKEGIFIGIGLSVLLMVVAALGFSPGEYEVLTYAGPSLWMTDPHQPSHAENFWWELENISVKFHNIDTVVIVGHSQCGGFELKGVSKEPATEKAVIVNSLKAAKKAIAFKYPKLKIRLVFVRIADNNRANLPKIFPEII